MFDILEPFIDLSMFGILKGAYKGLGEAERGRNLLGLYIICLL